MGNPELVYGMEYSENRLLHCKYMNPAIHYEYGDLIKKIPFEIKFDGIIRKMSFRRNNNIRIYCKE